MDQQNAEMPPFYSTWLNLNDCIEKSFFKAIIMITLAASVAAILVDLFVFNEVATSLHLTALCILILLIILYAANKVAFSKLTAIGLLALCTLFTYRGHVTNKFNHVTYVILITLGFVNALVGERKVARYLTILIFCCLLSMLFKDVGTTSMLVLFRLAIPYLSIFFIVTFCSSYLKGRYETNQSRLKEIVELLNQKNRKINRQNVLLRIKFSELEELSRDQEEIIARKTATITEKNRQLGDIAYANAHTIRGPLARILGLLNLIEADPNQANFYLEMIQNEANEMDEILLAVTKQIEANICK